MGIYAPVGVVSCLGTAISNAQGMFIFSAFVFLLSVEREGVSISPSGHGLVVMYFCVGGILI